MKQIYASLQFCEDKIRLLIGEYYKTRFNIIKLEEVDCEGLKAFHIQNKEKTKESLIALFNNATRGLGAAIEEVILIIPSVDMKRYSLKVTAPTKNGYLTKEDIATALKTAMQNKVDNNVIVVTPSITHYHTNGISSRRFQEKEICDNFSIEVDLLCANKQITFEYVSILEELNIKVMDICLDSYAICKEAALFERAINQNLILLDINQNSTTLSLLYKGVLAGCDIIYDGLANMSNVLAKKYALSENNANRLVKYNSSLKGDISLDAIYAWNEGDKALSINEKDVCETISDALCAYVKKIASSCEPILNSGSTSMVVTGEGASMNSLIEVLKQTLHIDVKPYFPDTIGVRDSQYAALYGAFFVYRDIALIKGENKSSIDLFELDNVIRRKSDDSEAETLTSKIKSLFDIQKKET